LVQQWVPGMAHLWDPWLELGWESWLGLEWVLQWVPLLEHLLGAGFQNWLAVEHLLWAMWAEE